MTMAVMKYVYIIIDVMQTIGIRLAKSSCQMFEFKF